MSGRAGGEFGRENRGVDKIPLFESRLLRCVDLPPASPPVDDGLYGLVFIPILPIVVDDEESLRVPCP